LLRRLNCPPELSHLGGFSRIMGQYDPWKTPALVVGAKQHSRCVQGRFQAETIRLKQRKLLANLVQILLSSGHKPRQ